MISRKSIQRQLRSLSPGGSLKWQTKKKETISRLPSDQRQLLPPKLKKRLQKVSQNNIKKDGKARMFEKDIAPKTRSRTPQEIQQARSKKVIKRLKQN